jgi:two-component system sensor histidine kinase KdpD
MSRTEAEEAAGRIAVVRDVTAARHEREHRDAFLGILSHELRTPITTVYAGSKVLARDERMRPDLRRELAADISAEAERLFRLVEDLLVMTRVERGALELAREPVLLQRVVAAAIRLEQPSWPTTRFVPSKPVDLPAVAGDSLYVEQVVRNLLSNAAKYSPPGSEVEVVVEEAGERAGSRHPSSEGSPDSPAGNVSDGDAPTGVSVRVLDRGTGFHAGEADDLFELFYRSPATAAQAAGAGIGLFVCRRLVSAMGGRIWARPRPDGGAEFGFTLPRYGD